MQTKTATTSDWLLAIQEMQIVPFDPKAIAGSLQLIGSPAVGNISTVQVGMYVEQCS